MKKNFQTFSFIYTLAIFGLGMIHISWALIGLVCYISPLVLYLKNKDKTWCRSYCPRASLLSTVFENISLHLKAPKWLTSKSVKDFFVIYMGLNFFFASMSTLMVALGRIAPMNHVRLFMAFKAPFTLPQLLDLNLPPFLTHYGYRLYSMMLSSIIIGFVLGFLFAPRSWCVVCPVNTLSMPKKLNHAK